MPETSAALSKKPVPQPVAGADGAGSQAPYDAEQCAADLVDVLPLAMAALRTGMRRGMDDALSVPQFRCLAFIDRSPGTSVSEVTSFLGVTMATTSAMVDRLASAGYVDVAVSEKDRRRSELRASPQGRALLARMRRQGRVDVAQRLSSMSPDELAVLRHAAQLLHRSFRRD